MSETSPSVSIITKYQENFKITKVGSYGTNFADEYIQNSGVQLPEKKLLAAVIQRAYLDLLPLFELGINGRRVYIGKRQDKKKAHSILRWFRSENTNPYSFRWILIHLDMEDYRDDLVNIAENGIMEDYSNMRTMV